MRTLTAMKLRTAQWRPSVRASLVVIALVAATAGAGDSVPTLAGTVSNQALRLQKVTSARIPVDIATRANDDGLYIAEQNGVVIRYDTASKGRSVVLNLTRFTRADAERGLLGLVFHPNGRYVFVNYTDSKGNTVVARYAMREDNTADPSTRVVVFQLVRNEKSVHNGGSMDFGPGGRLFISTGDSGAGNDPKRLALEPTSLFGKIVSIDSLARDAKSAAPKIWAIGLRNPWRFEFDDEMNLWVPDVGQQRWEELNVAWAADGSGRGANFGWSAYEGRSRLNKDQSAPDHALPAYVYEHGEEGCSIIGGTKVRDMSLPALLGWYVFGDYCTGRVTAIKITGNKVEKKKVIATNAGFISAVRSVESGEVYVLSLGGGIRVLRAG